MHLANLHLHLLSHDTSTALQLHFRVAHFPLQAQGLFSDLCFSLVGKAGLLNRDFLLATTCSFEGRSFPAKYCATRDCGSAGSMLCAWTLAFFIVLYWLLNLMTSFKINCTYPVRYFKGVRNFFESL